MELLGVGEGELGVGLRENVLATIGKKFSRQKFRLQPKFKFLKMLWKLEKC